MTTERKEPRRFYVAPIGNRYSIWEIYGLPQGLPNEFEAIEYFALEEAQKRIEELENKLSPKDPYRFQMHARQAGKNFQMVKHILNEAIRLSKSEITVTEVPYDVITRLERQNEKLRECVEHYADRNNWGGKYPWQTMKSDDISLSNKKRLCGKRARQVLAEIENEKNG